MKAWYLMNEESRKALEKVFKTLTGKEYKPPKKDIEDLGEIAEIMKEKPNYTISKQGRE